MCVTFKGLWRVRGSGATGLCHQLCPPTPSLLSLCLGFSSIRPYPFGWLTGWPMQACSRSLTVWPLARHSLSFHRGNDGIQKNQKKSGRGWQYIGSLEGGGTKKERDCAKEETDYYLAALGFYDFCSHRIAELASLTEILFSKMEECFVAVKYSQGVSLKHMSLHKHYFLSQNNSGILKWPLATLAKNTEPNSFWRTSMHQAMHYF